jgi:hypothetical protein
VESVLGIIKDVLGFRQFSLRGLRAAAGEWGLVCLAFNLKRLHVLLAEAAQAQGCFDAPTARKKPAEGSENPPPEQDTGAIAYQRAKNRHGTGFMCKAVFRSDKLPG